MVEVFVSREFAAWFKSLRDLSARARIQARIDRASLGNFGDCAPVGEGISEMRIHCGPGYRVYFMQCGQTVVILLCAGDKATQSSDIRNAKRIAKEWKD